MVIRKQTPVILNGWSRRARPGIKVRLMSLCDCIRGGQAGIERNTPYWYISGMDFPNQVPVIRVVSEEAFREAQLDQVVDVSFREETADVVLQRLSGWAGMELLVSKLLKKWQLISEIFLVPTFQLQPQVLPDRMVVVTTNL